MFIPVSSRAATAYRQVGVQSAVDGASPHLLIKMLFDGLIQSLNAARGALQRGDIEACSFFAEIEEASYNVETHTRTILKFKRLNDVSAVTFPAYENTSIDAEMRSAYGFEEAENAAAKEKVEEAKKRILLKF